MRRPECDMGQLRHILLDLLPGDNSVAPVDRLLTYVLSNRERLPWWREVNVQKGSGGRSRESFMADLDAGGPLLRTRWRHHVVERGDEYYVHA